MNFNKILKEISHFLTEHKDKYNFEVLNYYPQSLLSYEDEWLTIFDNKTHNELFDTNDKIKETQSSDLNRYLKTIRDLSKIDKNVTQHKEELPIEAFFKIKDKKKHELKILHNSFQKLKLNHEIENIIDIGGGIGNLSRIFSNYSRIDATCIEADPNLIQKGKKHLLKYPLKYGSINYLHGRFPEIQNLKPILDKEKSLIMGLHTCGGLAVDLIESHINSENHFLLSFGCCYHKLNPLTQINLSKASKENPLNLSIHALTLATRGHNKIDKEEYDYSRKMKSYRYSIHLYILEKLNIDQFISVGDGSKSLYNGSFEEYAFLKFEELTQKKIISEECFSKISKHNLAVFFQNPSTKNKVSKMLSANIIRWQLGRLIEIYILLDRALYLKEKGAYVKLEQYFDEKTSPRNIGILSIKKDQVP